jgi:UPF0755 protein
VKRVFVLKKIIYVLILLFFLALAAWYAVVRMPNVCVEDEQGKELFIPTGTDFDSLRVILEKDSVLCHTSTFLLLARRKRLPAHVHPGHYVIRRGMNNNALINMLRGGFQDAVQVTLHNIRTIEQLAGVVARQLEPDSLAFLEVLRDSAFITGFGFDTNTVIALFLPDTYEFYWTTSPRRFVRKMFREYKRFWDEERRRKAVALGLTPVEVATLASIVQEEVLHADEMPRVAGVYLNRLHKGMRLQADPTVKFALREEGRKRILKKDLRIDSPYNTYRYAGLPPGPIRMPSKTAIDAVLNAEKHSYLYFCAKDDFSGYHNFARTLSQHNRYARLYRRALNKKRIYR